VSYRVINADCIEAMAELDEASIDAIVCDPPYGLEFMGKEWDRLGKVPGHTGPQWGGYGWHGSGIDRGRNMAMQEWHQAWAAQALRILKPGGHLLAFGGTRTYHRLACAIEDAGFEIRDCIVWMYGSGFPKSLDVSKAIDKAAGAEREVMGKYRVPADSDAGNAGEVIRSDDDAAGIFGVTSGIEGRDITAPATPEAQQWQGWGTALKPAHEPIVVARKPLVGTVSQNVLQHGTGALNVDGTRIGYQGEADQASAKPGGKATAKSGALAGGTQNDNSRSEFQADNTKGRWPANVILDEQAAAELDAQTGELGKSSGGVNPGGPFIDGGWGGGGTSPNAGGLGDTGGASRFFYTAKTSRSERNAGLEGFEAKQQNSENGARTYNDRCANCGKKFVGSEDSRCACPIGEKVTDKTVYVNRNNHPTVKPIELMRWLIRLVTPPGGTVLDPFTGSGSTGCAAVLEGFDFIGIEREAEYVAIAEARIAHWYRQPVQLGLDAA